MAQTAGVYIERNTQGVPCFARIDLKKYGEKLMPFFKEIGIEDDLSPYNKEKDAFIHTAKINASKIFSKYL
jgi:hypothetical protein